MSLQYAPDYRLQLNGEEIPVALRSAITSISYDDGQNAADRVEVTIANANLRWLQSHIKGLGFRPFPTGVSVGPVHGPNTNDGLFDIDNNLVLSLGYADGRMEEVFKGEITGVEADFPMGGLPTMTVVAHDYLHRLSEGSYGRGFGPLPDMVIAAILSAENLLLPAIDPALAAASTAIAVVNIIFNGSGRKQKGQTDLQLLKEIAEAYDADFWVDGDVMYLSRFIKEYTATVHLKWGESLLSFSPRVSTIGKVAGVGVKFTLREIPLSFMVAVAWDFDRESLQIQVVPGAAAASLKSIIGPITAFINKPIGSPADITNSAIFLVRKLRQTINNRLTGTAVAVGDPKIRAGAIVEIEGVGPDFSGNYRIVSASHVINTQGYRTHFQFQKEILP
ncbi:MAG: phage late control D family protein [Bryobacteraceae bacterium]